MNSESAKNLRDDIGLRDGRVYATWAYKNLWWSLDYAQTYFGFGDLSEDDIKKIQEWLSRPENQNKVFTGWNEHHGTKWQETPHAIIRISHAAGLTRPDSIAREIKVSG